MPLSFNTIRRCEASAISNPPPSAEPLIAATTGLPSFSSRRSWDLSSSTPCRACEAFSGVIAISTFRSPPAKNVFLADVMITPVRPSSASRRETEAPISSWYSVFITFAEPDMSIVRVTMPSASFS